MAEKAPTVLVVDDDPFVGEALRLAADGRAGSALRISVSPTFIVNGDIYDGVPWDLERIVKRHLGR